MGCLDKLFPCIFSKQKYCSAELDSWLEFKVVRAGDGGDGGTARYNVSISPRADAGPNGPIKGLLLRAAPGSEHRGAGVFDLGDGAFAGLQDLEGNGKCVAHSNNEPKGPIVLQFDTNSVRPRTKFT